MVYQLDLLAEPVIAGQGFDRSGRSRLLCPGWGDQVPMVTCPTGVFPKCTCMPACGAAVGQTKGEQELASVGLPPVRNVR